MIVWSSIDQLGIEHKTSNKVVGILFAESFVSSTESSVNLQHLINIVYEFWSKWHLCANLNKSAVLVFGS